MGVAPYFTVDSRVPLPEYVTLSIERKLSTRVLGYVMETTWHVTENGADSIERKNISGALFLSIAVLCRMCDIKEI
jgi:hypothetical protein